jgi:anti-sigma factor RsiW
VSDLQQHEEIAALIGAYVLDAVDDEERAAVEAHLGICPKRKK